MLPPEFSKLSAKEQSRLGLPDGFKLFTPANFEGMNQSDSRVGMPDTDLFYMENLIHIGAYNLRALWDVGTALYTASGKTIVSFFFFSIGSTPYAAIFFSDGTAVQTDMLGNVTTISSVTGTFYQAGGSLPACAQWGAQYLLISNNNTSNDYWVWDATELFTAGTASPLVTITSGGSAYSGSSAPFLALSAFGGAGSGITMTGVVTNGSLTSVHITTPGTGYLPGDVVQLIVAGSNIPARLSAVLTGTSVEFVTVLKGGSGYSATPTVTLTGPAGSGATASATVVGGIITGITVTAAGSGYTGTVKATITDGTGSGALAQAFLTPTTVASVGITTAGNGYISVPTLTFQGGGGSGATATATLTAQAISAVTVTAPGTGYTSTPAVIVQSGINQAASGTITLMPFGISGSSIETFESRAWLPFPKQTGSTPTGGIMNISAPSSFSDFATSDGGLTYTSTDSLLRYQYTNIKQSNGYLYPFGDSSVSVISNVQTSGNPPTTTFNYQNTDPQVGTVWRDTCQDFSRTILFGNPLGAWGLYGGAVTKISKKLDSLFTNAIFPPTVNALTPSSAVANVFSRRIYCMLMTFKDPFNQEMVNKMVCWDEKDWFIASQTPNLIYIGTQEVNSNITAWGTDGIALYPLFSSPSTLSKKLSTKLYGVSSPIIKEQAYTFAIQAQDLSVNQSGVGFNVSIDTNFANPDTGTYTYPLPPINFTAPIPTYPMYITSAGDVYGMDIGATLTTTSTDFTINFLGLGYIPEVAELALAGG